MSEEGRITNPDRAAHEDESSLRPLRLTDFIGQDEIKRQIDIYVRAARGRKESLDHVLLYGPPGLGKTTLAGIVANELGVGFKATSAPAIERPGDLAAILTSLKPHDVLFIDEIHRLKPILEEVLYPALEDFSIDIIVGQGPGAKSIKINLKPFTLVGATTRAGLLSSPLRTRFGIVLRIDFYGMQEITRIVNRSARIMKVNLTEEGCRIIALRSRGTPRIANRILKRLRDIAEVEGTGVIDGAICDRGFDMLGVDEKGLDRMDKRLIETIIEKYEGGPVGVDTLSVSISEESQTIEDVYEPYLIQIGFIKRTPRGRVATRRAYDHFGLSYGGAREEGLFEKGG
jgi:Holliday junction DNA helicase RuvB